MKKTKRLFLKPGNISTKTSSFINIIRHYLWKMSPATMADESLGPAWYINMVDRSVVEVAAGTPLWIGDKAVSVGNIHWYLADATNPANQTTSEDLSVGEHTFEMLGGGSVAVSAGTATMTGAGSATEGNHVTINVTVAGTVSVAITGECTHFQLHTGGYPVFPLFRPDVGDTATRAGTQYADIIGKLLDALDGAVEGDQKVANGGFDTDSDWGKSSHWTISDGVASMPSTSFFTPLSQGIGLAVGVKYSIDFDVLSITGECKVQGDTEADWVEKFTTTGRKSFRVTPALVGNFIKFARESEPASMVIDNVSVKKVSQAAARVYGQFKIGVGADDVSNGTTLRLLDLKDSIPLYLLKDASGGNRIRAYDGTNIVSITLTWQANILYDYQIFWAWKISESKWVQVLKVKETISDTWLSAESDFVGRYPIGAENKFIPCYENDELVHISATFDQKFPAGYSAKEVV